MDAVVEEQLVQVSLAPNSMEDAYKELTSDSMEAASEELALDSMEVAPEELAVDSMEVALQTPDACHAKKSAASMHAMQKRGSMQNFPPQATCKKNSHLSKKIGPP